MSLFCSFFYILVKIVILDFDLKPREKKMLGLLLYYAITLFSIWAMMQKTTMGQSPSIKMKLAYFIQWAVIQQSHTLLGYRAPSTSSI